MQALIPYLIDAAAFVGGAAVSATTEQAIAHCWAKVLEVMRSRHGNVAPDLVNQLRTVNGDTAATAAIEARLAPFAFERDGDIVAAINALRDQVQRARSEQQTAVTNTVGNVTGIGIVHGSATIHSISGKP